MKITLPASPKFTNYGLFKAFRNHLNAPNGKILVPAKITAYIGYNGALVCLPYSLENLHTCAKVFGLNRFLFKKDRYMVPAHRIEPLISLCNVVGIRTIERIIKTNKL